MVVKETGERWCCSSRPGSERIQKGVGFMVARKGRHGTLRQRRRRGTRAETTKRRPKWVRGCTPEHPMGFRVAGGVGRAGPRSGSSPKAKEAKMGVEQVNEHGELYYYCHVCDRQFEYVDYYFHKFKDSTGKRQGSD